MSQIIYKSIVTTAGNSNFFKIDFYHNALLPVKHYLCFYMIRLTYISTYMFVWNIVQST